MAAKKIEGGFLMNYLSMDKLIAPKLLEAAWALIGTLGLVAEAAAVVYFMYSAIKVLSLGVWSYYIAGTQMIPSYLAILVIPFLVLGCRLAIEYLAVLFKMQKSLGRMEGRRTNGIHADDSMKEMRISAPPLPQ